MIDGIIHSNRNKLELLIPTLLSQDFFFSNQIKQGFAKTQFKRKRPWESSFLHPAQCPLEREGFAWEAGRKKATRGIDSTLISTLLNLTHVK